VAPAEGVGAGAEVRLHELTKTFGSVVAVQDVSVTIDPGSFFTLLGPSGSGKTTTLMMVAGFAYPTRGEVFVDGAPVAGLPPQKRDLGMVFQSYAVFPHLTVFDNIAFPLQIRHVRRAEIRQRVGEALELVRLRGYDGRLPRQLSGGEQQRVALARALVFRPRVLLMDEPLGALDKKLRAHMQLELKHIQRHLHVTVIYVTHDQEEALTMSDRVAVMQRGRIEQVGPPAELYEAPASRFVADFLGESNFVDGVVTGASVDGLARPRRRGARVPGCRRGAAPRGPGGHGGDPAREARAARRWRRRAGRLGQHVQGHGRRGHLRGRRDPLPRRPGRRRGADGEGGEPARPAPARGRRGGGARLVARGDADLPPQ
jgi:ABC-type Fe3+/spermidine/putrescine transport system ATPase subunit